MIKIETARKIVDNYTNGFKRTSIGNYLFSMTYWYGKWYITRCKKGNEDKTYIRNGEILTDWTRICEYEPKTGNIYPCHHDKV